jgi:hypothetical protein
MVHVLTGVGSMQSLRGTILATISLGLLIPQGVPSACAAEPLVQTRWAPDSDAEPGATRQWRVFRLPPPEAAPVGRQDPRIGRYAPANPPTQVAGGANVVRGQCDGCGHCGACRPWSNLLRPPVRYSLYDWVSEHPVLGYTAITAAIVVPIVIVDENNN